MWQCAGEKQKIREIIQEEFRQRAAPVDRQEHWINTAQNIEESVEEIEARREMLQNLALNTILEENIQSTQVNVEEVNPIRQLWADLVEEDNESEDSDIDDTYCELNKGDASTTVGARENDITAHQQPVDITAPPVLNLSEQFSRVNETPKVPLIAIILSIFKVQLMWRIWWMMGSN